MKNTLSHKCKHQGEYTVLVPREEERTLDQLKKDHDLKKFLLKHEFLGTITYFEADDFFKEMIDDMWEGHKAVCEECSERLCGDFCEYNKPANNPIIN